MSDFDAKNKARWQAALDNAFPNGIPDYASWSDLDTIIRVLRPFCAKNLNHTMLPRGGGQDIAEISVSKEYGCLELRPDQGIAYICHPSRLHFEHFQRAPSQSFFLLETSPLAPSAIYDSVSYPYEELLELPDGEYIERSYLDAGYIGHAESGCQIPIPTQHRLVVRFLGGKFLLIAKRSVWNMTSGTYDGRHDTMTHSMIRAQIEAAL